MGYCMYETWGHFMALSMHVTHPWACHMTLLNVDSPYTIILKLHSTYLTASDNIAENSKQVLSQLIKDLGKPTHSHLRDLTQNEANVIHLGQTTAAIIRAISAPAFQCYKIFAMVIWCEKLFIRGFYFIWVLVNENNECLVFILSNMVSFSLFLNINLCECMYMCMHTCVCTQGPEEGIGCPPHHFLPILESQSLSESRACVFSMRLEASEPWWSSCLHHPDTSVSVCTGFLAHSRDAGIRTPVFMVHSKWLLSPLFSPCFHFLKLETTHLWTATWHSMVLSHIVSTRINNWQQGHSAAREMFYGQQFTLLAKFGQQFCLTKI